MCEAVYVWGESAVNRGQRRVVGQVATGVRTGLRNWRGSWYQSALASGRLATMGKIRVGALGVVVALIALAQRLGHYENPPLAVALVIVAGIAFAWLVGLWVSDSIDWVKTRKRRLKQEADSKPKKMGFSEALAAEERVVPQIVQAFPRLVQVMTRGVQRQEEIKRKHATVDPADPRVRQRFNQQWIEHARNLHRTASGLRKEIGTLMPSVTTWKECQERYLDFNRETKNPKPPDNWIAGHDTTLRFRELVRKAAESGRAAESRWDPRARAMHRDLDSAVVEFAAANMQLVDVFAELDAMCSLRIDAVNRWNRPAWYARAMRQARRWLRRA